MTHDEWLDAAAKEMVDAMWDGNRASYPEMLARAKRRIIGILATRPAPGRAEVEKAVAEIISHAAESEWGDSPALIAARAAVLARMQPLGEVRTVTGNAEGVPIVYLPRTYFPGQRVRVCKVAE